MGFFNKPKPISWEVGDVVDLLESKNKADKQAREELLKQIKAGKAPMYSSKDMKKLEKELKRTTEGEKGLQAIRAAMKGGGSRNHGNIPYRERVHPSKYRQDVMSGKHRPTPAEAADLKKNDPAAYQALLEQERRRRGL